MTRDPFDLVVGQESAVATLRAAAHAARTDAPGSAMTHSWLITGPPGSGRSTAALAFAAALVASDDEAIADVLGGRHVDVEHIVPEAVEYSLEEARGLVEQAHLVPMRSRFQVLVVEDADRLSDACANALLKTLEEPPLGSVWVLCAPSIEDVLPTIRSRCRLVSMRALRLADVVETLVDRDGFDAQTATLAARAAQGHVGRARALAGDESTRERRQQILAVPTRCISLAECMSSAADLVITVEADVEAQCAPLEDAEESQVQLAYGQGATGRGIGRSRAASALRDLTVRHRRRRRRMQRDLLDRAITDLMSYYRDVLVVQFGAKTDLINADLHEHIESTAHGSTPAQTVRRIDALTSTRGLLESNVPPLLAFESMTLGLLEAS